MSRLESRFLEKLGDTWETATPGFCVQAFHRGKKIVDIEVGETYRYYDLASLTKIVFSATALMMKADEKIFRVSDPVSRWVPWFPEGTPHRLRDLLSHTAGLTWWYPFYKAVAKKTNARTSPEEAWEVFQSILKRKVLADVKKSNLKEEKAVYSDLDLFMLGIAMESISGTTLYTVWSEARDRMDLRDTDFHRDNEPKRAVAKYAPTEKDSSWRKKVLQGQVHDENTYALKGVAPHAGLFGTLDDLSQFGLLLRKSMRGEKTKRFASPETVRLFTKRAIPRTRGDWALGFMMPTKGGSSCGPMFSLDSVGHTGFTGTSLWYDPRRDLLVTLVSNRVYPTRENKEFQTLRPLVHTWIAEEV